MNTETKPTLEQRMDSISQESQRKFAEFGTERFTINATVGDQVDTLTRQLFDFCQKHQIPMTLLLCGKSCDHGPHITSIRSFSNPARVPKELALAAKIAGAGGALGDLDELNEQLDRRMSENIAKASPQDLLNFLFSR